MPSTDHRLPIHPNINQSKNDLVVQDVTMNDGHLFSVEPKSEYDNTHTKVHRGPTLLILLQRDEKWCLDKNTSGLNFFWRGGVLNVTRCNSAKRRRSARDQASGVTISDLVIRLSNPSERYH